MAALSAGALRLLWVDAPLSTDEAGFLVVGQQWHAGTSLYGDYWVDRPPLLIATFSGAAHLGGAVPLRLVGCLAVIVAVLAISATVQRLTRSARRAAWAAVVAAALLASPLAGAWAVNGELLAAPIIGLGVLCSALALTSADRRRVALWAGASGALAVAAVLIKQNMVDVVVVGVALGGMQLVRRRLTWGTAATAAAAAAVGALGTVLSTALLCSALGTDLHQLWQAMYPFRAEAAQVLQTSPSAAASHRRVVLLGRSAVAGFLGLLLVGIVGLLRRPRAKGPSLSDQSPDLALVALAWALWAATSIALGGNFWSHYLVQLALPCALLVGVSPRPPRRLLVVACAAALVGAVTSAGAAAIAPRQTPETLLGRSVAEASRPRDSVLVLWGQASIVRASGLPSPYEHLWTLPIKTLDPRLVGMRRVLESPRSPTWIVVPRSLRTWGLPTASLRPILRARYRLDASTCAGRVLVRRDVQRPRITMTCPTTHHESE